MAGVLFSKTSWAATINVEQLGKALKTGVGSKVGWPGQVLVSRRCGQTQTAVRATRIPPRKRAEYRLGGRELTYGHRNATRNGSPGMRARRSTTGQNKPKRKSANNVPRSTIMSPVQVHPEVKELRVEGHARSCTHVMGGVYKELAVHASLKKRVVRCPSTSCTSDILPATTEVTNPILRVVVKPSCPSCRSGNRGLPVRVTCVHSAAGPPRETEVRDCSDRGLQGKYKTLITGIESEICDGWCV
jgi:hypothetical protein